MHRYPIAWQEYSPKDGDIYFTTARQPATKTVAVLHCEQCGRTGKKMHLCNDFYTYPDNHHPEPDFLNWWYCIKCFDKVFKSTEPCEFCKTRPGTHNYSHTVYHRMDTPCKNLPMRLAHTKRARHAEVEGEL